VRVWLHETDGVGDAVAVECDALVVFVKNSYDTKLFSLIRRSAWWRFLAGPHIEFRVGLGHHKKYAAGVSIGEPYYLLVASCTTRAQKTACFLPKGEI
jgi:hypothetical protein